MAEQKLSVRAAVATVQVSVLTLLEAAGVVEHTDLNDVTVNINFRDRRIDIARLTEDGNHIEHWVAGFSIDPENLPAFGTLVPLPGMHERGH